MEKKMKWIGLEWRKGGEIGEKSCPKTHFFEKTHRTHFRKKKKCPFSGTKSPAGIPLSFGEGGRGAGPGPRLNGKGQGAGPGPNVNGKGQGAGPGPNVNGLALDPDSVCKKAFWIYGS